MKIFQVSYLRILKFVTARHTVAKFCKRSDTNLGRINQSGGIARFIIWEIISSRKLLVILSTDDYRRNLGLVISNAIIERNSNSQKSMKYQENINK